MANERINQNRAADPGQQEPATKSKRTAKEQIDRFIFKDALDENGFKVCLNDITHKLLVSGRTDSQRETDNADDILIILSDQLKPNYKGVTMQALGDYLGYWSREQHFNPIIDLIDGTTWDGLDRLPQLYKFIGVEHDELSKSLIKKWLMQAVAVLFNGTNGKEPFSAEYALILAGGQGVIKTSLFRHLAIRHEWFNESAKFSERDKDYERRIYESWISELGEVGQTFRTSDIEFIKGIFTRTYDRYRLPYGRKDVEGPRTSVLCGTTNESNYLIDPSGNRRFWTIHYTNTSNTWDDLKKIDALQVWAQIYNEVAPLTYEQKAECFRPSEEEKRAIDERNLCHVQTLDGEDEVLDIIQRADEDGREYQLITVTEWMKLWELDRKFTARKIGAVLNKLGIEVNRSNGKDRFRLLPV